MTPQEALTTAMLQVQSPDEDIDLDENLWIEIQAKSDAAAILINLKKWGWELVKIVPHPVPFRGTVEKL